MSKKLQGRGKGLGDINITKDHIIISLFNTTNIQLHAYRDT